MAKHDEHAIESIAILAYVAFRENRYEEAMAKARELRGMDERQRGARKRMLDALQGYDQITPDLPWTFCIAAELMMSDQRIAEARMALGLCSDRCEDFSCRKTVNEIEQALTELDDVPDSDGGSGP